VAGTGAFAGEQSSARSMLEDLTHTVTALGRTLKVLVGTNLLANLLTLLGRNGLLARLTELLLNLGVVSQILLATDEDDGETLAEVKNFRDPLLLDVVERIGRVDSEADQDNVRIGVRKRSETIVVFLASRIPKGQLDVLSIDLNVGDVVLENSGDVDLQ
jgi:hypothetical protein